MKDNWKALLTCTAVVALVLLMGTSTFAATQQTLTINATVSPRAELTLSPTTISFADASPASSPTIAANSTVAVTANVRTAKASTATLAAQSGGDLTSGSDTIPITAVSWTASVAPFIGGTMNTSSQSAATFSAGSGSYSGTYTFTLANSWNYNTGSYTATVTYTLTAP